LRLDAGIGSEAGDDLTLTDAISISDGWTSWPLQAPPRVGRERSLLTPAPAS